MVVQFEASERELWYGRSENMSAGSLRIENMSAGAIQIENMSSMKATAAAPSKPTNLRPRF